MHWRDLPTLFGWLGIPAAIMAVLGWYYTQTFRDSLAEAKNTAERLREEVDEARLEFDLIREELERAQGEPTLELPRAPSPPSPFRHHTSS